MHWGNENPQIICDTGKFVVKKKKKKKKKSYGFAYVMESNLEWAAQ